MKNGSNIGTNEDKYSVYSFAIKWGFFFSKKEKKKVKAYARVQN
jgi:hypothetical protein